MPRLRAVHISTRAISLSTNHIYAPLEKALRCKYKHDDLKDAFTCRTVQFREDTFMTGLNEKKKNVDGEIVDTAHLC